MSKSAQLKELVENTLADGPFEVVLSEFKKQGRDWVLRVYIDHPDGVTIDHCQTVTHMITERLEEFDPVETEYHIEVSSPGVDRPLLKPEHFQRFLDERVYVKAHKAADGAKTVTGTLKTCSDEGIEVVNEENGQIHSFAFGDIAKATLKPILNFS